MTQPMVKGRKLPRNDWEGDDFTPGAGGHYVTCQDTAVGRMVAYATNGRIDKDGKVYRAAIPHDPDGITLQQADIAVHRVAGLDMVIPSGWTWANVLSHLRACKGLVVDGWYAEIPRAYRYQQGDDFAHAMFISHYSSTSGMRVWDPLNPDTTAWGRWMPAPVIRDFLEELSRRNGTASLYVGYVPLQHL
jgi:hypothetical protein